MPRSGALRAVRTDSDRPTLAPPSGEAISRHAEIERALARHDYDAALALASQALADHPGDTVAAAYVTTCHEALDELYHFALSSLVRVPVCVASRERVASLPLMPEHAFVLSLIDGRSPVETVLDMTGLPHHVGLQALFALEKWRVVALR